MRNEPQTTLIGAVRSAVGEWRRREGWSRETVVQEIVAAHEYINGPAVTGIEFDRTNRDAFQRAKVNAERVFRWLDDEGKDCTLLPANFLPSVLAALPLDLKLNCINQFMRPLGLAVCRLENDQTADFNAAAAASSLAKEGTEAVCKILELGADPSPEQVERVCKELDDVAETVCAAKRSVRTFMH